MTDTDAPEWPDPADKAHAVEQAKQLRDQAAKGGLRFEAYLPPSLALWLLDLIEQDTFLDPSEAVFVILGEHKELAPHADLASRHESVGSVRLLRTYGDHAARIDVSRRNGLRSTPSVGVQM